MKKSTAMTHLFVDIGGVLLTNGWDHNSRKLAAKTFKLNWDETEERHHLIFDTYEVGKLTLKEYLDQVIFYKKRSFTPSQFRSFMFDQSKPFPEVIELIRVIKVQYGLKVVVISNEARELNDYRIKKFKLDSFIDFFISSCYVHLRKPDPEIYRLALETTQAKKEGILYIENTLMFVQIAEEMGINSILHTDYKSTVAKLASFGLKI